MAFVQWFGCGQEAYGGLACSLGICHVGFVMVEGAEAWRYCHHAVPLSAEQIVVLGVEGIDAVNYFPYLLRGIAVCAYVQVGDLGDAVSPE